MSADPVKARELFLQALKRPAVAERDAFLKDACGEDDALRRQVDILIEAHEQAGSFLENGVLVAPTLDQPLAEGPGTVIGPYKLLQEIGHGGMGVVYMAEQTEPVERRVALKIIKPGMDTRQVIARFEAERQALAMMDHPNIAKVLDAGTTGGNPKSEALAGNSKSEARNPKQIQNDKFEIQNRSDHAVSDIRTSDFELVSDFGFRASDFIQGRPYFVMELVKGVPITQYCDEHHLTPRERLENPSFYRLRAEAYLALERYDEALPDWNRCVALKPDDTVAALIRAEVLLLAGRTDEYREACAAMLHRFGQVDGDNFPVSPALLHKGRGFRCGSHFTPIPNRLSRNRFRFLSKTQNSIAEPFTAQLPEKSKKHGTLADRFTWLVRRETQSWFPRRTRAPIVF